MGYMQGFLGFRLALGINSKQLFDLLVFDLFFFSVS